MTQKPDPSLIERLAGRSATICVVGLGYVGLPVACSFAKAGFTVVGLDVDNARIDKLKAGKNPIEGDEPGLDELVADTVKSGRFKPTSDPADCGAADVFTINVQTPVDDEYQPNYSALDAAASTIGRLLRPGGLVIVESTVVPGTTLGSVRNLLEGASGLTAGTDFHLGACPERVMPGKLLTNLRDVARVCGGITPETSELMQTLYRSIVSASLDSADPTTAEFVKVAENTYRDVQIAFANEVALICANIGLDVWQVRELVNKVPFRDMHFPSGGVGGHCIPKDPWLLSAAAPEVTSLIPAARRVNDSMPLQVAEVVAFAVKTLGMSDGDTVLVLGYAYLAESDDTRNSPSEALIGELDRRTIANDVYDPFVAEYRDGLAEKLTKASVVVKMVDHHAFEQICASLDSTDVILIEAKRLGDARRAIEAKAVTKAARSARTGTM